MTNREKRSDILMMLLGDGNLHWNTKYNSATGYITIKHGPKQFDWLQWKKEIYNKASGKNAKTYDKVSYVAALNRSYNQQAFQSSSRKYRTWYKMIYPGRKKDITRILKFITNPVLATAVWLGDDATVQTSRINHRKPELGRRAVGLIIYTCDQTVEQCEEIKKWFEYNLKVSPRIKFHNCVYKGEKKCYPIIKFTMTESLILWDKVRDILLQIPSMNNKFNKMEIQYQKNRHEHPERFKR